MPRRIPFGRDLARLAELVALFALSLPADPSELGPWRHARAPDDLPRPGAGRPAAPPGPAGGGPAPAARRLGDPAGEPDREPPGFIPALVAGAPRTGGGD